MKRASVQRPATVTDVARLAGVSRGTVSKAMNGTGQLREETRDRVLRAAGELGFAANFLARSLTAGRTYTVGVLTSDSFGRFTIPVMLGAEDALGAGQISVLLCDGRGDHIREQHHLRTLLARRVDGLIVTGRSSDSRPTLGRDLGIPVVYVLSPSNHPDDLSFVPDDRHAAGLAVGHLLSTGRSHIVHVTGPARHVAARRRAEGAEEAVKRAGLEPVAGPAMFGEWSERWGREAVHDLLRRGESFDGVFCGNDLIARGVIDALREAGRTVPHDVAVVGVDNWEVIAEAARPPLTTVDLGLHEVGHEAASALLRAIDGQSLGRGVVELPCRLVARASSEPRIAVTPAAVQPG